MIVTLMFYQQTIFQFLKTKIIKYQFFFLSLMTKDLN